MESVNELPPPQRFPGTTRLQQTIHRQQFRENPFNQFQKAAAESLKIQQEKRCP